MASAGLARAEILQVGRQCGAGEHTRSWALSPCRGGKKKQPQVTSSTILSWTSCCYCIEHRGALATLVSCMGRSTRSSCGIAWHATGPGSDWPRATRPGAAAPGWSWYSSRAPRLLIPVVGFEKQVFLFWGVDTRTALCLTWLHRCALSSPVRASGFRDAAWLRRCVWPHPVSTQTASTRWLQKHPRRTAGVLFFPLRSFGAWRLWSPFGWQGRGLSNALALPWATPWLQPGFCGWDLQNQLERSKATAPGWRWVTVCSFAVVATTHLVSTGGMAFELTVGRDTGSTFETSCSC